MSATTTAQVWTIDGQPVPHDIYHGTHDIISNMRPKLPLRCVDDVVCWRAGGSVYWKAAALGVDLLTAPARLVPADQADADPRTRGPLPKGG